MNAHLAGRRDAFWWSYDAQKRAEKTLWQLFQEAFPIGSTVRWAKFSPNPQTGVIIGHGFTDRLKVRNATTGAELWLYAANLIRDT